MKGMKFFCEELARTIAAQSSCDVVCNQRIRSIHMNGVQSYAETQRGKRFHAKNIISNIDPHLTMQMVEDGKIPAIKKRIEYSYSDSIFQVFLGLKNVDLRQHGFGAWNIWHHSRSNMNAEYRAEIKKHDLSHPWLFIATPSLMTKSGTLCPPGDATMEILTFVDYKQFHTLYQQDRRAYERLKKDTGERFLDIIEKTYFPDIRKHIDVQSFWSPVDVERAFHSAEANVYGCRLDTKNINIGKLTAKSSVPNLWFVGATSGIPGIMGVIESSLDLYKHLTQKNPASSPVTILTDVINGIWNVAGWRREWDSNPRNPCGLT